MNNNPKSESYVVLTNTGNQNQNERSCTGDIKFYEIITFDKISPLLIRYVTVLPMYVNQ